REHHVELGKAYEQLQESAIELGRRKKELEDAYLSMARTLILTLESRDPYTRGHSDRVSRLVLRLAPGLGIAGEQLQKLELAARLHDIGKTGVADAVLLKPGEFDPVERAEIESHPTRGVEILRFLDFLKDILPIVESHHEWFNGSGYPRGLKGEGIPLGGRILSVADAYDAMVSKRPYRPALPHDEAIRRLREGAGTQWDPRIVEAFVRTEGGPKS
ncbi:MAG: HD-GYP domain-containing protein, partial [Dehalococcoidia bacterium]|nr:HD-GYP domain-containing protein [Dehalococcoidia bacterium]